MSFPPLKQLIGIPLNVALFLLLMLMGWGSVEGFLAHPARAGVIVLHLIMIPVMTFSTGGRSKGLQHAPDWKPFFPLLAMHSVFTAYVMPYMDARDIWVIPGGDVTRWAGFALLAAGVFLRLGPMMTLGRRFVSVVSVQADHVLHTGGFYRWVRHPSYVGILLMDLGFAGVFRSWVALALMPIVFWMFKRRMDVEEGFMNARFSEYREYMGRTARLIPGVY
jgi:protein-S-isoprenylcysteine O-methyltransferase Ste14